MSGLSGYLLSSSSLCLGCGRCDLACPVEIPLSKVIWGLKERYAAEA